VLNSVSQSVGSSSAGSNAETPPHPDELEVSIFGPSLGEAIVLHVGDGDWLIVDSCFVDEESSAPRPLAYLDALDARPEKNVKLIVATHWHDDHIGGMAQIVQRCKKAKFAISGAFTEPEFQTMMELVEPSGFRNSGVTEFWKIWGYLDSIRRDPTHSSGGKELYFRREGMRVKVWALSPGDRDVWLAIRRFRSYYQAAVGGAVEYVPPLHPNDASVVVWVTIGDTHILLGADLKQYKSARRGWKAVLDDVGVWHDQKAEIFKVSHHGSQGSYEPRVWTEMLIDEQPIALLSPFVRGDTHLPTAEGINDIKSHTSEIYISSASSPGLGISGPVMQTLREAAKNVSQLDIQQGQVRLRKALGASSWAVDLFPPAARI
jgi:hypothetical protein